jgi:hypothetical protein
MLADGGRGGEERKGCVRDGRAACRAAGGVAMAMAKRGRRKGHGGDGDEG